ncbi:MAG: CheR family methyltransferase [Candidatus Hydrogenedentota bacterium]
MEQATFEEYRALIYQKSGIALASGKEALVSSRVAKRMRQLLMDDHRAYLRYLKEDTTGEEIIHLLDAISTNVTSFYRESAHFEILASLLAEWHREGQRRFRIWCAAASSGEEPYTIAMTLLEALGGNGVDMRILATDISTRALASAMEGVYGEERVKAIPKPLLSRYFDKGGARDAISYSARQPLRNLLLFRRLNLSEPPFPMRGPLDVVFCRNVMIYFDNRVRGRLLDEAYRLLKPGGYLFVGHAESLTGMVSSFKLVRPSVYRKA